MNPSDFVSRITGAGFKLAVQDDRLMVSPSERLTDPQRQFIKTHKPAIIAALAGKAAAKSADPDHGTDTDQETLARAVAMLDAGHRLSVDGGHLVAVPKNRANDSVVADPDQGGPIARLWNCTTADGRHFEAYFPERIHEAEARRLTPEAVAMEPVFPALAHSDAQNGAIDPEPLAQHHLDRHRGNMGTHGAEIPLVVCGECQHFRRNQIGDPVTGLGSCPTMNPPGLLWPGTERHCAKFAAITTALGPALVEQAKAVLAQVEELERQEHDHLPDLLAAMGVRSVKIFATDNPAPIDGEFQRIDDHTHASEAT